MSKKSLTCVAQPMRPGNKFYARRGAVAHLARNATYLPAVASDPTPEGGVSNRKGSPALKGKSELAGKPGVSTNTVAHPELLALLPLGHIRDHSGHRPAQADGSLEASEADRRRRPRRARVRALLLVTAVLGMLLAYGVPASASHPEVSLAGSNFEIDTDANLKADDAAPSIDWGTVAEVRKVDKPTGAADDSFGQGTKEDTAVPTVVDGSIPPQKSDLRTFGVYQETVGNRNFMHMFWHRVQEPQGTTNLDFEFNQSTTVSGNGVTPVRTAGDLLVQYD